MERMGIQRMSYAKDWYMMFQLVSFGKTGSARGPWGLAFAAGAMLFVVSAEMIPKSHRKGFAKRQLSG